MLKDPAVRRSLEATRAEFGDEASEAEELENQEWIDSLEYVLSREGPERVRQLMRMLQAAWNDHHSERGVRVRTVEALGWDGRALEAVAFAVFAYQHVKGVPCGLPNVTGAKKAVVLGVIAPGR